MGVQKPLVLVVGGATASGKTRTALCLAQRLNGEIISADSMQIYRGLDIGTAKATPSEQQMVPHHLIDRLSPGEAFSVADFQAEALAAIRDILSRGRLPIVCGGTGQYISALMDHLTFSPMPADANLRTLLEQQAEEPEGAERLLDQLRSVDPETAAKLHVNNIKRLIRALEVFQLTGRSLSEWNRASHTVPAPYQYRLFILNHDRPVLYARIERRVVEMFDNGLLDEARWLLSLDLSPDTTCWQAIGYKELLPHLRGEQPLEAVQADLCQATRRYAKRQLTWFRGKTHGEWLENQSAEVAADKIEARLTL